MSDDQPKYVFVATVQIAVLASDDIAAAETIRVALTDCADREVETWRYAPEPLTGRFLLPQRVTYRRSVTAAEFQGLKELDEIFDPLYHAPGPEPQGLPRDEHAG